MEKVKKRILVIDDDERLLETTKGILEAEGFDVMTHCGSLGSTNLVKSAVPDMVMLDMNMPALSGETLAKVFRLNDKTKDIPVVFYSSNDEDTLRSAVAVHGAKGYICKGNLYDLRAKVHKFLAPA